MCDGRAQDRWFNDRITAHLSFQSWPLSLYDFLIGWNRSDRYFLARKICECWEVRLASTIAYSLHGDNAVEDPTGAESVCLGSEVKYEIFNDIQCIELDITCTIMNLHRYVGQWDGSGTRLLCILFAEQCIDKSGSFQREDEILKYTVVT